MIRRLIALCCSIATLSGCAGSSARVEVADAITAGGDISGSVGRARLGTILLVSTIYRATRDITLDGAELIRVPDGLELLGARVNFLNSKTRVLVNGHPGTVCSRRWPLRGFGPTYEPRDLTVRAGEQFAAIFYLRVADAGFKETGGVRFRYRMGSGDTTVTQELHNAKWSVEGDKDGPLCHPKLGGLWIRPYTFPSSPTAIPT